MRHAQAMKTDRAAMHRRAQRAEAARDRAARAAEDWRKRWDYITRQRLERRDLITRQAEEAFSCDATNRLWQAVLLVMLFAAALALTGCATTRDPPPSLPPIAEPCPAEGTAAVRAEPPHPLTEPVEKGRVYGAVTSVVGPDRAQAIIRFWETEVPTWGRQGWERVGRTKAWCDAR